MLTYMIRRVLLAIPVLIGILFLTFALARLLPSDPCRATLGERATDAICDAFNQRNGLDKPIWVQFRIYAGNVLQGDLGNSFRLQRPVTDLMVERLPVTLELSFFAMVFAITVGVPLGVISAYYHKSMADVLSMVVANAGVSMPVFWLGLMLAYFFGVTMKDTPFWLPPSGRSSPDLEIVPFYEDWNLEVDSKNPPRGLEFVANIYTLNAVLMTDGEQLSDALRHLILPSIALGTIPMSIIARITRSSLLEVLGLQYVRTARAKGLRELTVVMRHALRNALLPVVTIIGLWMGSLVGGAILTETIFGFSGVGRIMYDSITARDYTVIQGFTLVIAVAFVFVNLIVDLLYSVLDPRIRLK